MPKKEQVSVSNTSNPHGITRRTFTKGAAAGIALAASSPFNMVHAAAKPLNIALILPLSGLVAQAGISCARAAKIAKSTFAELGVNTNFEIRLIDFESNTDKARILTEKAIDDGANLIIGGFLSGATTAMAQVCEQRSVPLVVNIAAAPQITEQGYQNVFRNFATGPMIVKEGLLMMKDIFASSGTTPKKAVFMHINDTFGQSIAVGVKALVPRLDMPFEIVQTISYDPKVRDLSIEVRRAKASGADFVMPVTRINDAIMLVKEMVKQRWSPQGLISPGSPGMYEKVFYEQLGKYSEYCITNVPWYNPKSEVYQVASKYFEKEFPDQLFETNVCFTFEAILIAADAHARSQSNDPAALREALRSTNIKNHLQVGGPIQFDEKGQNTDIRSASIQNRDRKPTVVMPAEYATAKPVWPMPNWKERS